MADLPPLIVGRRGTTPPSMSPQLAINPSPATYLPPPITTLSAAAGGVSEVPGIAGASEAKTNVVIELFGSRWFEHDDAALFRCICEKWLLKYFDGWDPSDEEQMSNPQKIIDDGGYIVMARIGDETVGTGCLLSRGVFGVFEVAKMGVLEGFQGKGVGKALLAHLIQRARDTDVRCLKIESSSKLDTALQLYRKFGFVDDPEVVASVHDYKDADIFLQLEL